MEQSDVAEQRIVSTQKPTSPVTLILILFAIVVTPMMIYIFARCIENRQRNQILIE